MEIHLSAAKRWKFGFELKYENGIHPQSLEQKDCM
jgi:hypothetical protein